MAAPATTMVSVIERSEKKQWRDASWWLLEKVRTGELCESSVDHDLAQHVFDTAGVLIVYRVKSGRSWDLSGFIIGSIEASGHQFTVAILCSKPGGGSALLTAMKQYASDHQCTLVQLYSVANAITFYRKNGFELARPGKHEVPQITALADSFLLSRFKSFKEAVSDAGYYAFLDLLRKKKLTKQVDCLNPEDCDVQGYSMIYYLAPASASVAS
jgi:hypothetical protein